MGNVQDAFKYNRARKNVIIGGAVILIVLFITLADPVIRLIRIELRYLGKQQEAILGAKTDALESDKIRSAMAERADYEADRLADQIIGAAQHQQVTHYSPTTRYVPTLQSPTPKDQSRQVGKSSSSRPTWL